MGKTSASDITYLLGQIGDTVKDLGLGKGGMKTGAKAVVAGAVVVGSAATVAAQKVGKLFSKKKNTKKKQPFRVMCVLTDFYNTKNNSK